MALRINTVIRKFMTWAEGCLSPSTISAYRHQLRKWQSRVPNKVVNRLRPIDLTAWAKSWHEAQAIIRVLNWAANDARLIRHNPLQAVRKPGRGLRRRILTPQQMELLVRKSSPAARAFLVGLRETLGRPQEIRAATWDQLQPDTPGMPLDRALASGRALIVQTEFKDCRRRRDQTRPRVLLVSVCLGKLLLHMAKMSDARTGEIFRNTRGRPWTRNAVRIMMRRLRKRCKMLPDARGENVTAYTFRHSLATWAAAAGVVDRTLADLLGHVETRTTTRYLHLQVSHLRKAMAKIAPNRAKVRKKANRNA